MSVRWQAACWSSAIKRGIRSRQRIRQQAEILVVVLMDRAAEFNCCERVAGEPVSSWRQVLTYLLHEIVERRRVRALL